MHILLVEDEPKIADFVCAGLAARGFRTTHCADGEAGYQHALHGSFDVIVLDIMLPGRNGLDILQGLRTAGHGSPVILLTARNELDDRVQGLALGADDYLAKPFYVEELIARIQALYRRTTGSTASTLTAGNFTLDRLHREVAWQGQTIDLTSREFKLLEYLMRSPGQVFTRTQILEHVWGYDFDPSTNMVDVCIQRIRKKFASLNRDTEVPSPIESVRGVGYRFQSP